MANEKTVNIANLTQEAIEWQDELRLYAYYVMQEELNRHGIRQLEIANIDREPEFQRKSGIAKPYSIGGDIDYEKLGKFEENELKLESCYAAMKDHRSNYQSKKILNQPTVGIGENQNKRHPLENLFISQSVRTFGEDVLDALFFGERDLADKSPLGMFDGYETIVDAKITAGTIATILGNLYNTGAITPPANSTDTDAIDQLVAFLRNADPILRRQPCLLMMTYQVLWAASDALKNTKKSYSDVSLDELSTYLRNHTGVQVTVVPSLQMGTGDRIHLTIPANFDLGMNTFGDEQFVQVRDIYEDPNFWQFWIQAQYGCRIRSVHKKVYQTNNGTPVGRTLSGDYDSGSQS